MKIVKGFVAAVLASYLLGVIFISQGNLARIVDLGLEVDMGVRFNATMHDLSNMVALYAPLSAIALLIALLVCHQIVKRTSLNPAFLYALAGFTGMIALHMLMKAALTLTGIAPTRTVDGLLLQGVAGAAGAYVYYRLTSASVAN